MNRVTSVSLGQHAAAFIDRMVKGGRYGNASDVMRAALRLLEERELRLTALRTAYEGGAQSGGSEPVDAEALVARKRRDRRNRA